MLKQNKPTPRKGGTKETDMPKKRITPTKENNKKKIAHKDDFQRKIKIDEKNIKKMLKKTTINKIAYKSGFIKRNRKLNAFDFFISVTFGSLKGTALTLSSIVEDLSRRITRSSVNERFNENAYYFLKEVYSHFFKKFNSMKKNINVDLFKKFNEIKIIDSSSWKLPKALKGAFAGYNESGCKIQLMMNYKAGTFSLFDLTNETVPDQRYSRKIHEHIEKNDLCLFDLAYVVAKAIIKIHKKSAFFYHVLIPRVLPCMLKKEINFIKLIF